MYGFIILVGIVWKLVEKLLLVSGCGLWCVLFLLCLGYGIEVGGRWWCWYVGDFNCLLFLWYCESGEKLFVKVVFFNSGGRRDVLFVLWRVWVIFGGENWGCLLCYCCL